MNSSIISRLLTLLVVSFLWIGSIAQRGSTKDSLPANALYMIDSKESTKEEVQKLDPKTVRRVNVFKDEKALKIFGEKGRNGVIMVITTKNSDYSDYDVVFTKVEQPASFPGGEEGWKRYIERQLKYPEAAQKNKTEGRVRVQIVIDKMGNLTEVQALDDPGDGLAAEAMRLLKRGPKWIPAKQNGRDVTYRFVVPVIFKL